VKRINYAIKYSRLNTNGFSAAYDTTGKENFDKDGYASNNASAQLSYQASDELTFRSFVQYNQYKNDIDANAFIDDRDFKARNRNLVTGGSFQFKKQFVNLAGNYQYSEIYRNYLDDSSDVPAGNFSNYSKNYYYGKSQFAELYAGTAIGSGFTLLQGADYRYTSMNSEYVSGFSAKFRDTSVSQASLYASITYNGLDSNLNIELGGRMNVHSRYGNNYTYTFNPSYRVSNHFRMYGTVATAFKAPGLYQLYDAFSGNELLEAEQSINYELGFTQQHALFTNRVVFFYRDIRNGIDYNYLLFKYFNFSRQIARGVEWEVNIRPVHFMTAGVNYTYLSIHETTQDRMTMNKNTLYRYAIKRPKHNLNVNLNFQLSPSITLSATAKHVSRRYDLGGSAKPDVMLEAYTIYGAHATYSMNDHVSFFADAQNITNKKFFDARGYQSIPFIAVGGITLNW
jgi:vitamin B12 transporter